MQHQRAFTSITTRPVGLPSMAMSKKTFGRLMSADVDRLNQEDKTQRAAENRKKMEATMLLLYKLLVGGEILS